MLELLQLRSGVEPELVGQLRPDPLVRRQRVGLAPRPVQRGDQQLPQAFLERVRRDGRFQLADHVADVAEPQPRRELGLDELRPCLVESCPVRGDPIAVAGGVQHLAAVHRQGRRAQLGGATVVAVVEQTRRGVGVAQHRERVDLGRVDRELIAAIAADDHARIPERLAQPRDLRLQGVAARVRRAGRPTGLRRADRCARARRPRARGAPALRTSCRPAPRHELAVAVTSIGPSTEIWNTAKV